MIYHQFKKNPMRRINRNESWKTEFDQLETKLENEQFSYQLTLQ